MRADLVVVGAGPAGMAASLAAADLGREVTLLDGGSRVGGQVYRQSDLAPPGRVAAPKTSERLPERFHRLVDHPRVRWMPESTVWLAERRHGRVLLRVALPRGRSVTLDAAAVVLAAGATEIALPFPGWELPGVTTAGAAQALLKSQGLPVGRRVLVAGSGPFLLPVAADLADAGATVVSVLEATRVGAGARHGPDLLLHPTKLGEAAGYAARLARHGVAVRPGAAVVACHGRERVQRATVARLDAAWRPVPGSRRDVEVDAVCVTHGFTPALELPRALGCAERRHRTRPIAAVWHDRDQATSAPGVFAAGETTGVGGAQAAELEGTVAGYAAARYLGRGRPGVGPPRAVRRRLAAARRFAGILDRLYAMPTGWLDWLGSDTVLCRCEDVTWDTVRAAVADGAYDMRSLKGLTRCGMGYCQGRVCGPPLQCAFASLTGGRPTDVGDLQTRAIAVPVPLGFLAELDE